MLNGRRAYILLAFWGITLLRNVSRAAPPTAEDLAAAAQKTRQAFREKHVNWGVVFNCKSERISVHCESEPGILRESLRYFSPPENRDYHLDVTSTEGVWYVDDIWGHRKYRPYEAPLPGPWMSAFLDMAIPRIYTDPRSFARILSATDLDAEVRLLDPATLPQLQRNYDLLKNRDQQLGIFDKEDEKMFSVAADVIKNGVPVTVARDTGLMKKMSLPGDSTIQVDYFAIDEPSGEMLKEIHNSSWEDHTSPIYDPRSANSLMMMEILRNGAAKPVLYQAKSGEIRAIPFPALSIGNGCFSKDRRKIYISAITLKGWGLYEEDLVTHETRRIAPDQLFFGAKAWDPAISPDGNSLAVVADGGREWITYIVDLKTNVAKEIGRGMDDEIGWTADGQSLIGWLSTDAKPENAKSEDFVIRMDMRGKITTVTHGNKPKILSDGEHVVFSKGYWKWFICDLDGNNEHSLGDGYESYQHISPGPTGNEFIATHYVDETRVPPVISISNGPDIKDWKPLPKGAAAIRWR